MKYYNKKFETSDINLYPIGDWHLGSEQCQEGFIKEVLYRIKHDPRGYFVGMGDFMENAIIGSKSDVYRQILPPRVQMNRIVELLKPIKEKGLFLISGNHESRTHRLVGLTPEEYIGSQLDIPFKGFSCYALFQLKSKIRSSFKCYFHHNTGGGYTHGTKVNRSSALRVITPTADAVFSGHSHITCRIPFTWYEISKHRILAQMGYNYIIGSALDWSGSYAEEKGKPAATCEHIVVNFKGYGNKKGNKEQAYEVILPTNGRTK